MAASANPAASIPNPPETIQIDELTVACDGPGGALGHPRVYLNLEGLGAVDCPYCDRRYVLRKGAKPAAH